jgi:hypothetical protein
MHEGSQGEEKKTTNNDCPDYTFGSHVLFLDSLSFRLFLGVVGVPLRIGAFSMKSQPRATLQFLGSGS